MAFIEFYIERVLYTLKAICKTFGDQLSICNVVVTPVSRLSVRSICSQDAY